MTDIRPRPTPCHAVIFISRRGPGDEGYTEAAEQMLALGSRQPGFLGFESVRGPDGTGITVAFYDSPEALHAWGRHPDHRAVQEHGRSSWYESYEIYYALVESGRRWERRGP